MGTTAAAAVTADLDVDIDLWGERLQWWRKVRDLTQKRLSEMVSEQLERTIGQDAVSEWETGRRRPTDPQRIALARALDVPVAFLFPYPPDVR